MTRLLGFELRKMLRRPFTLVVALGCLGMLVFYCVYDALSSISYAYGPDIYGSYEAIPQKKKEQAQDHYGLTGSYDGVVIFNGLESIRLERERTAALAGQWDEARFKQAAQAFQAFEKDPDNYLDVLDDMSMQIRRWRFFEQGMSEAEINAYDAANPIYVMKPEKRYGAWQEWGDMSSIFENFAFDETGAARSMAEVFPNVAQPAGYRYHTGPARMVETQGSIIGVLLMLVILAGVSPIFCDEVSAGTEPMLLAARYGRSKLVAAKLLAGVAYAAAALLLMAALNVGITGALQGFDGFEVPVQMSYATYNMPYGFSFGTYLLAELGIQLVGAAAMAMLVMWLSSLMRSAFPVVFTGGVFTLLVTFFGLQMSHPMGTICLLAPPSLLLSSTVLYKGATTALLGVPLLPLCLAAGGIVIAAASVFIVVRYRRKR